MDLTVSSRENKQITPPRQFPTTLCVVEGVVMLRDPLARVCSAFKFLHSVGMDPAVRERMKQEIKTPKEWIHFDGIASCQTKMLVQRRCAENCKNSLCIRLFIGHAGKNGTVVVHFHLGDRSEIGSCWRWCPGGDYVHHSVLGETLDLPHLPLSARYIVFPQKKREQKITPGRHSIAIASSTPTSSTPTGIRLSGYSRWCQIDR